VSKKHLLVAVLIALAGAGSMSVIGQEEPAQPLPVVQVKVSSFGILDPVLEIERPSLAEAARRHDYVSFSAVYLEAQARGETTAAYDNLYELWTWSMNDPLGAFYGSEFHNRLARAYPDYASYIAQYSIVDDRGSTFYPTAETRAFLLERAMQGGPAPRVAFLDARPTVVRRAAATPPREPARLTAAAPQQTKTVKVATAPKPKTTPAPAKVVETPARVVEAPKVVVETPAVTTPAPAPVAEAPVVIKAEQEEAPVVAPDPKGSLATRRIILVVISLLGLGFLMMILRTPTEKMPESILAPPADEKPPAPVEPIRRVPTPAPRPSEEKPRATGSHG